jgi:hypothetical protein
MNVSVHTRFEIFKRDGFICQYCGRGTPDVVLELDHVVPRAEGGSDDDHNLVTACWDCNRGKRDTLLDERAPVPDLREQTAQLVEREEQIRAYEDAQRSIRERENESVEELLNYWDELTFAKGWYEEARRYPANHSLRFWLRTFSTSEMKEAMEIAIDKAGDWRGVPYMIGILKNWRADRTREQ